MIPWPPNPWEIGCVFQHEKPKIKACLKVYIMRDTPREVSLIAPATPLLPGTGKVFCYAYIKSWETIFPPILISAQEEPFNAHCLCLQPTAGSHGGTSGTVHSGRY